MYDNKKPGNLGGGYRDGYMKPEKSGGGQAISKNAEQIPENTFAAAWMVQLGMIEPPAFFSLIYHMHALSLPEFVSCLPHGASGAVFAFIMAKRKNIVTNCAVHVIFNMMCLLVYSLGPA